ALERLSEPGVELSTGVRLTDLEYADDIVILGPSTEDMQTMLNKVSDRADLHVTRFIPSKYEAILEDWGISTPNFFIRGFATKGSDSLPVVNHNSTNNNQKKSDITTSTKHSSRPTQLLTDPAISEVSSEGYGNCVMQDSDSGGPCVKTGALERLSEPGVELSTGVRLTDLEYADDIVILGPSTEDMQTMLNKVSDRADLHVTRFIPSKYEAILEDWGISTPNFFIVSNSLEAVDTFANLGSNISSTCNVADGISMRIAETQVVIVNLRHL
ncbi:uncharacterized protein DEA37_0012484, partial [Paragonimus westermani]